VILGTLSILSLSTGYMFKDLFSGLGSNFFNNGITLLPSISSAVEQEFVSLNLKMLPVFLTCISFEIESKFFECKWFYNEMVNGYLSLPMLILSRHYFEQYEKRLLEQNGPLFFQNLYNKAQYSFFIKIEKNS
jgi:hypothetical protein